MASSEEGDALVSIEQEDLTHYQCGTCGSNCINPRESDEAEAEQCRECFAGEKVIAPQGGVDHELRPGGELEPWRYACPYCERRPLKEIEGGGTYRCNSCKTDWQLDELVDRREEGGDESERLRRDRRAEAERLTETLDAGGDGWSRTCPLAWCEKNDDPMDRAEYREHVDEYHSGREEQAGGGTERDPEPDPEPAIRRQTEDGPGLPGHGLSFDDEPIDAGKSGDVGEDIAELVAAHEAIDWADVPGVSVYEAGAWTARLIEAGERAVQ